MSVLAVNPATFTMSTKEILPFAFDTTPLLVGAEVPTSPVIFVTQLDTGASVPGALSGSATISGNLVNQKFTGVGLTAGKSYRVEVTFAIVGGKTWDMELTLVCPY